MTITTLLTPTRTAITATTTTAKTTAIPTTTNMTTTTTPDNVYSPFYHKNDKNDVGKSGGEIDDFARRLDAFEQADEDHYPRQ